MGCDNRFCGWYEEQEQRKVSSHIDCQRFGKAPGTQVHYGFAIIGKIMDTKLVTNSCREVRNVSTKDSKRFQDFCVSFGFFFSFNSCNSDALSVSGRRLVNQRSHAVPLDSKRLFQGSLAALCVVDCKKFIAAEIV